MWNERIEVHKSNYPEQCDLARADDILSTFRNRYVPLGSTLSLRVVGSALKDLIRRRLNKHDSPLAEECLIGNEGKDRFITQRFGTMFSAIYLDETIHYRYNRPSKEFKPYSRQVHLVKLGAEAEKKFRERV